MRRPEPLDHASSGTSGWIRTSSPGFGSSGHVHVRRRDRRDLQGSSPGNRTPPSGLEDPSPIHRPSHRASGGSRTRDSRFAGACLTTWRPTQHADGGEDRNRTGRSRIASAARPLGTCLPGEQQAVPTRIELAWCGRQPHSLPRGIRDQIGCAGESNPRCEVHRLACWTTTLRTPW
jgi:hypothetical protein